MKKRIASMILTVVLCLSSTFSAFAEDNSARIAEIEAQIAELQAELDELTGGIETEQTEAITEANVENNKFEDIETGNFVFHYNKTIQIDSFELPWETKYPEKDGNVFLIVYVEAKNVSDEDDYINMYYSSGYVDGYAIEPNLMDSAYYDTGFYGDIAAGRNLAGCIMFEIPSDWQEFEYVYYSKYDSVKASFIITPKDLEKNVDLNSKDVIQKVQEALNAAGYDCGEPDGIAGSGTKATIEKYQADKSLVVTGSITDELLESLGI